MSRNNGSAASGETVTREAGTGKLLIEGVKVEALAKAYGTPLYIYSQTRLLGNFRRIQEAFAPIGALVAYSMKSNSSHAILKTLVNAGAGLDIVSGGELELGLAAGADPAKIIFAGVGKTREEIARALDAKIKMFNVESEAEAGAIAEVAARKKTRARVCLRVNPDVDAATHHYISTGKKENKFGIAFERVRKFARELAREKALDFAGVHCHIGSQILETKGHIEALGRMAELIELLRRDGHNVRVLNFGGGFGIAYKDDQKPLDVGALAEKLIPKMRALNVEVIFEPGRSISGPAGFLLTRLIYVKPGETHNFAIIDGAMNDLIRPALYSAYHRILLDGAARRGKKKEYDIVGPICESGDFLGKGREFPPLEPGDLFLVCDAGAYGMVMASNYNARPRPAEVMVRGAQHALIRRRETIEDLRAPELEPDFSRTNKRSAPERARAGR